MSDTDSNNDDGKKTIWLGVEIKSPPFSDEARREAGFLIRALQDGMKLSLPHSRPMPVIGSSCHELRINDGKLVWRIVYKIDAEKIIFVENFTKKSRTTPQHEIEICKQRLVNYDRGRKQ